MSHQAIAAALAQADLSVGERLVAFSLASFADRDNLARPGTTVAAGRAGLGKSGFLEAQEGLMGRGLVVVVQRATGRGRASLLALPFAEAGPWWEGDVNAALFEAVLGYSSVRGSARLLLAAMAALADECGVVEGFTTEELCAAAGITERTYGRVRGPLLASGELVLRVAGRGRGNRNCWAIPDPRAGSASHAPVRRRRVRPPAGARPLVASVSSPRVADEESSYAVAAEAVGEGGRERPVAAAGKDAQDWTVLSEKGPDLSGVSGEKGCQDRTLSAGNGPVMSGLSARKGGQVRTLPSETPAENPAENPAPNARAGREPQNPRTHPPSPPGGGSDADELVIEEEFVSERGRQRRRRVTVDLAAVRAQLTELRSADRGAWQQIRALLLEAVGESTFEIWLSRLELLAVDRDGRLVVGTAEATRGWVCMRFGRVLELCADRAGRGIRFADEREHAAVRRPAVASPSPRAARDADGCALSAAGGGSVCQSSYTNVYKQEKEVS
jgi:hypothetical protein